MQISEACQGATACCEYFTATLTRGKLVWQTFMMSLMYSGHGLCWMWGRAQWLRCVLALLELLVSWQGHPADV